MRDDAFILPRCPFCHGLPEVVETKRSVMLRCGSCKFGRIKYVNDKTRPKAYVTLTVGWSKRREDRGIMMKGSQYIISEVNSSGEHEDRTVSLSEYKDWLRKNSTLKGETLEKYVEYKLSRMPSSGRTFVR